jgi:hypothetical protein
VLGKVRRSSIRGLNAAALQNITGGCNLVLERIQKAQAAFRCGAYLGNDGLHFPSASLHRPPLPLRLPLRPFQRQRQHPPSLSGVEPLCGSPGGHSEVAPGPGNEGRLREAFSCLGEARRHVQEGPTDTAIWRHIGEAVMLADQVGRQQRRFAELRGPTGQNLCAEVLVA